MVDRPLSLASSNEARASGGRVPKMSDEAHSQRRGWLKNGNPPGDFSTALRAAPRRDAEPLVRVQQCATAGVGCMAARAQGRGPRSASSGVDARTGNTERAHESCANCRPRIAAACENSRRCSGNFDARSFGQVLSVRSKRRERSCDPSLGPRSSWWPSGASGRPETGRRRGRPATRSAQVTTDNSSGTACGTARSSEALFDRNMIHAGGLRCPDAKGGSLRDEHAALVE